MLDEDRIAESEHAIEADTENTNVGREGENP
jgi:hypothetical protein